MPNTRNDSVGTAPDPAGTAEAAFGPRRYRDGFAQLLDLTAPPIDLGQPIGEDATRLGFERVGAALHKALADARERFGR